MDRKPSAESKEPPAPEVLHPREADGSAAPEPSKAPEPSAKQPAKRLHRTYRPSHKATFIGLAVVVLVLAVNAGIIAVVVKSQSKGKNSASQNQQVTLSSDTLSKLGVNRSSSNDLGVQLTVGPDAKFDGKVTVGGDTTISGQLILNSKFSANDASLAQLEAGNTSLSKLDVNGDTTLSNVAIRNNVQITGTTTLQGPVTLSQLLTVNNNANITGSLSVGGTLAVNNLHVSSLVVDSTVTIGGHVITRGNAPSVSPGGAALGSNGTVSISGNDQAGTVGINIGAGAVGGLLASVTFRSPYSTTPHVVVTPIGYVGSFYISRGASGFSIYDAAGISPGGYAFDYIVEQ